MIGKPLSARYELGAIDPEKAETILRELLATQARHLVEVRARGNGMIACLVTRADESSVRLCKSIGFALKRGGTGVFGLMGDDATRLFRRWSPEERAWLLAPSGARETKVILVAGGLALLSIEARDRKAVVEALRPSTGA